MSLLNNIDPFTQVLFDSSPVGIVIFDETYRPIHCNEAILTMLGVSRSFLLENFASLSPEFQPDGSDSSLEASAIISRTLSGEELSLQWMHRSQRGSIIPCSVRIRRCLLGGSNVAIAFISDLSLQKHMLHEKDTALSQAQETSRMKSSFLARMSHEMRTPMNIIMGMTQIAQMTQNPQKKDDCLGKIGDASAQMMKLVENLLDMTSMEYDAFILNKTPFSFSRMFEAAMQEALELLARKKQTLHYTLDANIPPALLGDEGRLAQVVGILIGNASKFTQDKGSIRVTVKVIDNFAKRVMLEVTVNDNGIGISKEDQVRLFDAFEQVDGGLTRQYEGLGLGLTLAKRIVELMEGEVTVVSEPGNGSTFSFTCFLEEV